MRKLDRRFCFSFERWGVGMVFRMSREPRRKSRWDLRVHRFMLDDQFKLKSLRSVR